MAKNAQSTKLEPGEVTDAEMQVAQKGLALVGTATLKEIIASKRARKELRHKAIAELHKRPGGTLNGLDMLDDQALARLAEDISLEESLRLAAADVLALR